MTTTSLTVDLELSPRELQEEDLDEKLMNMAKDEAVQSTFMYFIQRIGTNRISSPFRTCYKDVSIFLATKVEGTSRFVRLKPRDS